MNQSILSSIYIFLSNGGNDYDFGLSLYAQVDHKKALLRNLQSKSSEYNKRKLVYELDKYLNSVNYIHEATTKTQASKPEPKTAHINAIHEDSRKHSKENDLLVHNRRNNPVHSVDRTDFSDHLHLTLQELTAERNLLYKQRDHLHPQLVLVDSDQKRFEIAREIQAVQPAVDRLNNKIKQIKATGVIDEETAINQMSAVDYKTLQKYRSYIRRYKRLVKSSTTSAETTKYQNHLEHYQALEKQLLNNE